VASQLYAMRQKIEEKIKADRLDAKEVKGKIALISGKLLAFINESTADDPVTVTKMRRAAAEVLRINL